MKTSTLTVAILFVLAFVGKGFSQEVAEHSVESTIIKALLSNEDLRREIEMTNSQLSELKSGIASVREEFRAESNDLMKAFLDAQGKSGKVETFGNRQSELNKSIKIRISEEAVNVLLPFQMKRLTELSFQLASRRNTGYSAFLTSTLMVEQLKIDKKQKRKIETAGEQLQAEFEEDMEKLKSKYRNKLNDCLSDAQRKKLDEILGDKLKVLQERHPVYF